MTKCILTIVSFIVFCTYVSGKHRSDNKVSYSIVLDSCFENDTISLSINGISVFENSILNSDFSTGLTQFGVYHQSNDIVISKNGAKTMKPLANTRILKLIVSKNGKQYPLELDVKNGKNILIDGCEYKIKVTQFKKQMIFE